MSRVKIAYEKNAKSLQALRDLLHLVVRQPARFAENTELLKALNSQGGVASLELSFEDDGETKTKERMSVNTLKAHSENVFERGFEGLDALRKGASDAIQTFNARKTSSNKRTKIGLAKRTEELEAQLEHHQKINMVLLQGLSIAISELRTIRQSVKPAVLEKRAKDAVETLLALLSINPPPFDGPSPNPLPMIEEGATETHGKVADMEDYRK